MGNFRKEIIMKSRIARPAPTILIYGIAENSEKFIKIHELCKSSNFTLKSISSEDTSQQLGYLFGFNGFSRNDAVPHEIPLLECMVFSGFNSKEFDKILTQLKTQNIKTDLKAVVTAHNQKWTFEKLISELSKEKASIESK